MNVYDIITERILKKLEEGTVPWRKPWQGGDAGIPRNVQTGFPYRGINAFLLAAAGYASPYWLTFRQAKRRGGNVRKGEHGTPVIFWKWRDPEDGEHGGEDQRAVPVLRYYLAFNLVSGGGLCDRIGGGQSDRVRGGQSDRSGDGDAAGAGLWGRAGSIGPRWPIGECRCIGSRSSFDFTGSAPERARSRDCCR